MKKILTLIGTITIIGSGAGNIISCGGNHARDSKILDLITKTNIEFVSLVPPKQATTTNKTIISELWTALVAANPKLPKNDPAGIKFESAQLVSGKAVPVKIEDSQAKKFKLLQVKYIFDQAQSIVNQVTKKDITVPAGTNPSIKNAQTIKAIMKSLQAANPSVASSDWKYFTLVPRTARDLVVNTKVTETYVVNVFNMSNTSTASFNITVKLLSKMPFRVSSVK